MNQQFLSRVSRKIKRVIYGAKIEKFAYQSEVDRWFADPHSNTKRFDYPLSSESLVLDVGGFDGVWAMRVFARFQCRIFVFEPSRARIETLNEIFKGNAVVRVFPFGLGSSSRKEALSLAGDGSSFYSSAITDTEEAEIVDVSQFLQDESLKRIDLLKVNIEGGEYELLARMIETGLIKHVANLQVQFHFLSEQSKADRARIREDLAKTHTCTYCYEFVWENWTLKSDG